MLPEPALHSGDGEKCLLYRYRVKIRITSLIGTERSRHGKRQITKGGTNGRKKVVADGTDDGAAGGMGSLGFCGKTGTGAEGNLPEAGDGEGCGRKTGGEVAGVRERG